MGKRGPKPSGKFAKKGATLGARITIETRKRLERAAKASGSSLSQEVENRLAASLASDTEAWFLRWLTDAIKGVDQFTGQSWLTDPYTFDLMAETLAFLFKAFRPKGEAAMPSTVAPLRDLLEALPAESASAREKTRTDFEKGFAIEDIARTLAIQIIRYLRGSNKESAEFNRRGAVYLEGLLTDPHLLLGQPGLANLSFTSADGKRVWFTSRPLTSEGEKST